MISRLGSGRDGYVWKATTVNKNLTVVKFFNNTFTKEKVEKETVIWKNAWDITTLSVSMNNYQCLLMPFLKIVDEDEDDWKDHRFLKLVELAVLDLRELATSI